MKLKLDPGPDILRWLPEGETIEYSVPFDLWENRYCSDGWILVTKTGLYIVKKDGVKGSYRLKEFTRIRVSAEAHSGILEGKRNGEWVYMVSFTMRHIIRISYAAAGAERLAIGKEGRVESREPEKYCPKCGRAYQGAEKCPHCDSKFYYLKQIWNLVKSEKTILFWMAVSALVINVIVIYWPMLEKDFVDGTLRPGIQDPGAIIRFFIIMVVTAAVMITVECIQYYICVKAGANIGRNLRARMYHKLQLLGMDFIHKRKTGELMNRIQADTGRILDFMTEVFCFMFSVMIMMVMAFVLMMIQNPLLTLFSLGTIIIVAVLFRIFFNYFNRIWTAQMRKEDAVENRLQDVLSGMKIVKSYGQEEKETKAFAKEAGQYRKISTRNETVFAVFYPLLMFLMELGTFFAIYFGGRNVLFGTMTQGELLQYVTYAGLLFGPLVWMTSLPRQVMQLITSMNRISDILDEEPTLKIAEQPVKKDIEGDIRVEHVTFGYEAYETVLEDISFDLKKGEMLGLVGESGSGKTTTINLLMRLYDVNEGRILVDGIDIRTWDPENYHSQIGVVLQENFLFSGTILQNLRFAKPEATLEEIISACKAANAHDFICKLPDGYDTYVGEKGSTLSGGERQRISIARALLADPRILILDEATASLDTESEYQIQQAIERLITNRTTIAIAHRLSTLKNATKLIVIDSKHIAEMGSHNELLEKKGIYHGLVEAQLKMQKGNEA